MMQPLSLSFCQSSVKCWRVRWCISTVSRSRNTIHHLSAVKSQWHISIAMMYLSHGILFSLTEAVYTPVSWFCQAAWNWLCFSFIFIFILFSVWHLQNKASVCDVKHHTICLWLVFAIHASSAIDIRTCSLSAVTLARPSISSSLQITNCSLKPMTHLKVFLWKSLSKATFKRKLSYVAYTLAHVFTCES